MKSLGKISAQAPNETSLGKMSLYKISRFVRACAVEMHMDMSSKPFGSRIYRKCRAPEVCRTFCASLRIRNAHGHVTRAILCKKLQEKCRAEPRHAFMRACAVEMHMDVSQEPFGAEIDKENAESPGNHFE